MPEAQPEAAGDRGTSGQPTERRSATYPVGMDDDPRAALEARLEQITPTDLPDLATAWSETLSDELAATHLVLAEHERGDLSHVLGPVLDRIPHLAALVTEDEFLTGAALVEAEHALEVLEGVVVLVHAADLIPAERRATFEAAWRRFDGRARQHVEADCTTKPTSRRRSGRW